MPALDLFARQIAEDLSAQCIDGPLVDADPNREGVQPECSVVEEIAGDDGQVTETALPSCERGQPPCWRLVPDSYFCASGFEVRIDRGKDSCPLTTDHVTIVRCATCPTDDDPRCH